jgi:methylglutaconyl-CoA hydratase
MFMSLLIKEEIEAEIVLLKLNRPQKRNALNIELLQNLSDQIEELNGKKRVLILCGADPVFCSGMDIAEAEDKGDLIAKLFSLLYTSSLLTIAAVQGAVLAGGMGLMAACDLAIAHPKTFFGLPELQRGLVPAQVIPLLMRQMPMRDLKELIFLGETIESACAKNSGLINQISEKPVEDAIEWARLALKGAPEAMKLTKQLFRLFDPDFPEHLQTALDWHHKMLNTEEASKGISAFLKKRG